MAQPLEHTQSESELGECDYLSAQQQQKQQLLLLLLLLLPLLLWQPVLVS